MGKCCAGSILRVRSSGLQLVLLVMALLVMAELGKGGRTSSSCYYC